MTTVTVTTTAAGRLLGACVLAQAMVTCAVGYVYAAQAWELMVVSLLITLTGGVLCWPAIGRRRECVWLSVAIGVPWTTGVIVPSRWLVLRAGTHTDTPLTLTTMTLVLSWCVFGMPIVWMAVFRWRARIIRFWQSRAAFYLFVFAVAMLTIYATLLGVIAPCLSGKGLVSSPFDVAQLIVAMRAALTLGAVGWILIGIIGMLQKSVTTAELLECSECGYDRTAIRWDRCPECGAIAPRSFE